MQPILNFFILILFYLKRNQLYLLFDDEVSFWPLVSLCLEL